MEKELHRGLVIEAADAVTITEAELELARVDDHFVIPMSAETMPTNRTINRTVEP